jgi:hypothetical protein
MLRECVVKHYRKSVTLVINRKEALEEKKDKRRSGGEEREGKKNAMANKNEKMGMIQWRR